MSQERSAFAYQVIKTAQEAMPWIPPMDTGPHVLMLSPRNDDSDEKYSPEEYNAARKAIIDAKLPMPGTNDGEPTYEYMRGRSASSPLHKVTLTSGNRQSVFYLRMFWDTLLPRFRACIPDFDRLAGAFQGKAENEALENSLTAAARNLRAKGYRIEHIMELVTNSFDDELILA